MTDELANQYVPDYAVPPGQVLLETIEAKGMTQTDLAVRTGYTKKAINEIIKGKAPVTHPVALRLERATGVPARLWNNLETNYREALERIKERKKLAKHTLWLKELPWRAMIKLGWIEEGDSPVDQLIELLKFFEVATPDQWREKWCGSAVAFRKSPVFEADPGAVSAWLQRGELQARSIDCKPYDKQSFRDVLTEIRSLTSEDPEVFQPQAIDLCASAGVALVFVPQLPRTRASGATRWLAPGKALIQLSLRYRSDDHLWFTFFHEAAHILLHGKRDVFIEIIAGRTDSEKEAEANRFEAEANRFAAGFLIPSKTFRAFLHSGDYTEAAIRSFAAQLGVAPGIVVGRLQHEGVIKYNARNQLKRRLQWASPS